MTTTHHRACNLCEAICGLTITVENGTVSSIEGDKNDPLSKGHICPKAFALKDIYEDPNRLKYPMKRTADGWEQISWEAAFDEIEAKMKDIQAKYGTNAVGLYHGNPSIHNLGTMANTSVLIKSFKTKNTFSATSTDQLPHHFASWLMFGHPMLLPVPDISRTDFMLILGGNPIASNGSMMTAPDVSGHLKNIQKRGGKVVVIDPRKTETADKATTHFFIKPATDAMLLLSLIHVFFKENKVTLGENKENTDGTSRYNREGVAVLEKIASEFSPDRVAAHTGISAENITQLALDFANAKSAVCYGRIGVSTQAFGGLCQWLINCINILTDNFDKEGGAMFTKPAIDILMGAKPRTIFGRWQSRVRKLNEFMGELPVSALAEEILTEGEGQIKAMITNCGNPILSTPNGEQLEKAFAQLDFMVAIDIYLNESSRHAHIILPPATGLEVPHYDITFNILAVRNTAKYSAPTLPKAEGMKYDWEIMQTLAHRMTGTGDFTPTPPEQALEIGLQFGPYNMNLQQLIDNPSGVDLGELQPCMPERLIFDDKKIQLAPALLVNDIERLKKVFENEPITAEFPMLLIGRRHLRDNNSWLHNSAKLMKGHHRCTLMMHSEDAKKLNIIDKMLVNVTSRVGNITVLAEITDDMMQGVVSMPHGYGHTRKGTRLDVAEQHAGANVNDLTDELILDDLTGNVAFSNVMVRVAHI